MTKVGTAHIPARAGSSMVGGPLFPDRSFANSLSDKSEKVKRHWMQIRFTINDSEVRKRLSALATQGHALRPLMQDIGEEVRHIVEKNFEAGFPNTPWLLLSKYAFII